MHFRCELDALHVFVFDFGVKPGAGRMCQAADLTLSGSLEASAHHTHTRHCANAAKNEFSPSTDGGSNFVWLQLFQFYFVGFCCFSLFFLLYGLVFADQPINSRMQPTRCYAFACIQVLVLVLLAQISWGKGLMRNGGAAVHTTRPFVRSHVQLHAYIFARGEGDVLRSHPLACLSFAQLCH